MGRKLLQVSSTKCPKAITDSPSSRLRCWDFYAPGKMTPETRRKVIDAIRLAALGGGFELAIGGECYVGVSPEGVCDLVRFVTQWGAYPIDIPDDAE